VQITVGRGSANKDFGAVDKVQEAVAAMPNVGARTLLCLCK